MKKEWIYKLIEKGYKGGVAYDQYVGEFIYQLRCDNYIEMSEHIREIQEDSYRMVKADKK